MIHTIFNQIKSKENENENVNNHLQNIHADSERNINVYNNSSITNGESENAMWSILLLIAFIAIAVLFCKYLIKIYMVFSVGFTFNASI